jgi:hypothetical protein
VKDLNFEFQEVSPMIKEFTGWWRQHASTELANSWGSQTARVLPPVFGPDQWPHLGAVKGCENCGLFNHTTKECRKVFYEICGYNNHSTYECKRSVLWNTGPELCAAQVEEQSFFFIEECIDPKISKEKECIGVISIIQGHATGKQIEQ